MNNLHADLSNIAWPTPVVTPSRYVYTDHEGQFDDDADDDENDNGYNNTFGLLHILNDNLFLVNLHRQMVHDGEYEENEYEMDNDDAAGEDTERFLPRNLFIYNDCLRVDTPVINDTCYICLEDLNADADKQIGQIDDCRHGFCSECLFNWLKESCMCPVCRTPCAKINLIK
ncbi:ring finger [Peridroma alphabaculovirus]|uniref:Ring finger n=1 Tax=Peridroma alphabaculovirus TaxID=1346829 RepID=A0A068LMP1_9ABAC|nr:ring finger [Peridroma alphabaculovirus]AIE47801.1 ring finger [Peridroma alphabaculovirus]